MIAERGDCTLLGNSYVQTHLTFTRVNKIEDMYDRWRVNLKVEPRSTLTFTRDLLYIVSILFTCVKVMWMHIKITQQWNLPS